APLAAGTVACALTETFLDEAEWVADRVASAWRAAGWEPGSGDTEGSQPAGAPPAPAAPATGAPPTTAVLVRRRDQIPAIEAALRARGLPVEVVGLGGLLDTPEVRDVVSTLRVLADPTDGASPVRLLTGAW